MNSLVVLFTVVALATAKPSGLLNAGLLSYAAPSIVAAPVAVSSQSRIDIKSSPAVLATAAIAPVAKTIIAEPALVAAPAAVVAPVAVSSQSRIDLKSSPGVISTIAAAPLTTAAITGPTLIKSAIAPGIIAPSLVKTVGIAPAFAAPGLIKSSVLAPVIVAPGLIKSTVIGSAVPLETPEVIAARTAHLQAKALAGAHLIAKRSAPLISAPLVTPLSAAPIVPIASVASIAPLSPVALSAPVITKAYGVHPW